MKISVVTVVYNNLHGISKCIESVQAQNNVDVEHVIIDGCSDDGTSERISKLCRSNDIFISEPDNGIYDALNKGFQAATGDILGILHSDDQFADQNVLLELVNQFSLHSSDVTYGNAVLGKFDKDDKFQIVRHFHSGKFPGTLAYGWMPPHPALFFKKSVWERIGPFDKSLKVSADYEWIVRLFLDTCLTKSFFNRVITLMEMGGVSTDGFASERIKFVEDYQIIKQHKLPVFTTLIFKKLRKLFQYRIGRP